MRRRPWQLAVADARFALAALVAVCLLACAPPARAVRLQLTLGDAVEGDHEALHARALAALRRCAAGREVEVWLTLERQRRRLRATTRLLQGGQTLGERQIIGHQPTALVDAAALLVCVALARLPPAPPPRPPSAPSRRRARRGPVPPPAAPTLVALPAALTPSGDGSDDAWAGRFELAIAGESGWAPGASGQLRLGYGREALPSTGALRFGWHALAAIAGAPAAAVAGDTLGATGAFGLGLGVGGSLAVGRARFTVGALAGAARYAFADAGAGAQWAPWLAADVVVDVAVLRAGGGGGQVGGGGAGRRWALRALVGASPRLVEVRARVGGVGEGATLHDAVAWRVGLAFERDTGR